MILVLLSYLGGALTIVSPCILPVLPFVFARAGEPFLKSGLPMLLGMAVTFAGVATLAAVGGGWAVQANSYARIAALVILAGFGLLLLFPAIADRAMRPLVTLGSRLSQSAGSGKSGASAFAASLLLGVATGLLWAPCAGPILGLLLTGAALNGASAQTTLLLLAYAAGAATSLALALAIGGRVFAGMKKSLGVSAGIRKVLGAAVLVGVLAIALGLDTGLLTRLSLSGTSSLEQSLLDRFHPDDKPAMGMPGGETLAVEGEMPPLTGATEWINSSPLTREQLKGKVVVVDFWTYSCINCLRSLPYVRAWAEKYKAQGLVVIGVHSPEFAFEKDPANVRAAVRDLKIGYPVALDNDLAVWRAFDNHYWPAHYFIDGQGRIRHHHFGEGGYAASEKVIQRLLAENGKAVADMSTVTVSDQGVGAAASGRGRTRTPETYVGYSRAEGFVPAGGVLRDTLRDYAAPALAKEGQWGLTGQWTVGAEQATAGAAGGRIAFRFKARDLHLVMGPSPGGKPVRYRITIDGKAPGTDHGVDADAAGRGVVTEQRLYQLVRQRGVGERLFEIEFLDPGVQAFAFTFG